MGVDRGRRSNPWRRLGGARSFVLIAVSGCVTTSNTTSSLPKEMPALAKPVLTGNAQPSSEKEGGGVRQVATSATTSQAEGPSIPPAPAEYPIDLTTALRLAEVENPRIAAARQRIGEALAVQQGARALLLPTLNAGTSFNHHSGDLQRTSGGILDVNRQSLYFGGGAGAVGTGTVTVPAVNIASPLTDAIFEPLAARQLVSGAQFSAAATANTILLEVAELHFELLAAEADLKVRRQTAEQAAEVARLTRAYASAGQGREADAERAATELNLIDVEIRQAEEQVAVVAARLARRLHVDQAVRLRPVASTTETITLIDPTACLPDLIKAALQGRPEMGAKAAGVLAADARHKEEVFRPWLPTIWLGFSGGAFGGGSNLTGIEMGNFAGRTDFDVMAYWTLRNLGLGNRSLQKQRWAQVGQAVADQSRIIAQIRSEVERGLCRCRRDPTASRNHDPTARQRGDRIQRRPQTDSEHGGTSARSGE